MYLTALRVLQPATGAGGVNAFHYAHDTTDWISLPHDPDEKPGRLVNQNVQVPVGGNRMRSYLDLIAPDDAPWEEIRQGLLQFVLDHDEEPMPWSGRAGRTRFWIGMEQALAQNWSEELAVLWRAVKAVRLPAGQ